jgi:DNA-binding IclR family transcriptional regulator
MIQVIERMSEILEHLSEKEKLSLKELHLLTGLKKPTLYVILKTLISLGYIKKTQDKKYTFADKMYHLTYSYLRKNTILSVAQESAENLKSEIKEAVVVAILHNGERYIIAQASAEQSIIINTQMVKMQPIYSFPTGRILLSFLSDKELKKIVDIHGLPGSEWNEIYSYRKLKSALAKIRKQRISYSLSKDRQVRFLAVPVLAPDGNILASIGVSLPSSRFRGKHKENIIKNLMSQGERMSYTISLLMGNENLSVRKDRLMKGDVK